MAKIKVFAPFDSKLQLWMQPMFFHHSGQAERTWKDLCNEKGSILNKHPEDFVLYQIGEYDDHTGALAPIVPAVQLMTAIAALVDTMPATDYPKALQR